MFLNTLTWLMEYVFYIANVSSDFGSHFPLDICFLNGIIEGIFLKVCTSIIFCQFLVIVYVQQSPLVSSLSSLFVFPQHIAQMFYFFCIYFFSFTQLLLYLIKSLSFFLFECWFVMAFLLGISAFHLS